MNNTLEYAENYINQGLYIHPLVEREKKPLTKNGFKDASADPKQIAKWFKGTKANIGIVTGRKNKIGVIDIDPKNGGLESLKILQEIYKIDVETLTSITGSDGLHFFYEGQEPIKSRIGILPGIDIKGDGGYIVAPPSIHPNGKPYYFKKPVDGVIKNKMKPFPYELISLIDEDRKKNKKKKSRESKSEPTTVTEGGRHNHLVQVMGRLRGMGLPTSDIKERLHLENITVCLPPLDSKEVDQIVGSIKPKSIEEVLCFAPHTDFGNAERFIAKFHDDAKYIAKMEKWHIYDGKRFVEDSMGVVTQMAKYVLRISRDVGQGVFNEEGAPLVKHLRRSESIGKISAMIKLAQTEVPVHPDRLNPDPFHFNVLNGTIDLRTGSLLSHQRDHLITKLSHVTFDPSSKCPLFLKFMNEVTLESQETIEYLQRVVGYCMTGITNEQCLWILYGDGSNGKTTFLNLLKKILGEYGRSADISTFTQSKNEKIRNDLARLFDARLVSCVELQEGKSLDESIVKQVTGTDPVTCRFLFKEHFEYVPQWKLFMVVNHLPHINGTDYGIWRRVKPLPFVVQFSETQKDKELQSKLERELPGILNWAIEGCLKWQREGLKEPSTVSAATNEYKVNEDSIGDFLNEFTDNGADLEVGATALFEKYAEQQKKLGQKVMSQKQFAQKIKIKGFKKNRGTGGRYYYLGLALKTLWPR